MVNRFPNNSIINVSNAVIIDITSDNATTFVTISYTDRTNNRRSEETVRLVVGRNTTILNENGNSVRVNTLARGMMVNASFSSAMTRSIPPQAAAFLIRIISRPVSDNIVTGRVIDVDRDNRSFTVIRNENPSSIIRFNLPLNTPIYDRNGRLINFSRLLPGTRVRVRHASFMTASIPPQTTAFEVRVL